MALAGHELDALVELSIIHICVLCLLVDAHQHPVLHQHLAVCDGCLALAAGQDLYKRQYVDSGKPAVIVEKDADGKPTVYVSMAINMGNFAETYELAKKHTNEDKTWYWTCLLYTSRCV